MTQLTDQVWRTESVIDRYLTGVRGGIPLAAEQIRVIVQLCQAAVPTVDRFLDLGCGDGVLGRALLRHWPRAQGVFLDFSEKMLAACIDRLGPDAARHRHIECDYGDPRWVESLQQAGTFDVVVSGFSIHHQEDDRKREMYREILHLLRPGGLFLNLEHVASASPWGEEVFNQCFLDSLVAYHARSGSPKTPADIASEYFHREDKAANRLAPVEDQCQWLRQLGYERVDCFFKLYELALFGGARPVRNDTPTHREPAPGPEDRSAVPPEVTAASQTNNTHH